MRKKRLAPIALLSLLLIAAVVAPTAAGLPKVPPIPKGALPVQYPVTIDTAGYVNYTWTYDSRSKCTPGYEKTVTEKLTFTSNGPKRGKIAALFGKAFSSAVRAGTSELSVELTDWQETNYCEGKPAKIEKATCRDLPGGKIVFAIVPESEDDEGGEALTPLVGQTNFILTRTKPVAQDTSCYIGRPNVKAVHEAQKDWYLDPKGGISVPLAANSNFFRYKLAVGETMRRHINISGNCERATAAASALPSGITSCDVDGHLDVVIKRVGR